MREIIFRGKTLDGLKWVYGDLIQENSGRVVIRTNLNTWDKNSDVDPYGESLDVKPDTVGQYTGQKDRNGKEIFEGDIINYIVGRPGFFDREDIEWRQNTAVVGMRLKIGGTDILAQKTHCFWDIDVIGNIHDNPELLEDEL